MSVFRNSSSVFVNHGKSLDEISKIIMYLRKYQYFIAGRFVPTEDKPNTKRFKATFRCALNSLPDCKELSDLNHKGGTNAYKVYQFFCNSKYMFFVK